MDTWATQEAHEFYFVEEVAEILRMDVKSVRRLIKQRRIAVYQDKPGAVVRIAHADLMAYLCRMRVEVEPEKEHKENKSEINAKEKVCG